LAKPYPTGTFTLQDTPSFLGAITAKFSHKKGKGQEKGKGQVLQSYIFIDAPPILLPDS
jgi:hypothetical protein